MSQKKYASLQTLQTFLANLKNTFADLSHKHTLSDVTDYVVDEELSATSTNPVQNKVIDAELEAVATAMNALDATLDSKADIVHNTEANWLLDTTTVPEQGTLVVYDIDDNYDYERIKIGDGEKNVNDLPFVNDALKEELIAQIDVVDDKVDVINTLIGETSVADQINEALLNNQSDWKQYDSTKPDYIKNKPDENDALELVSEMGLVEPVLAEDGSVYTDENGVLYTL